MFANALRMQARLALVAARAAPRTFAVSHPALRQMQMRAGMGAGASTSRLLSTTPVQRYEVSSAAPRNPPAKTVWIGNLPFFVSEEEVREKFAPYGPIVNIRLSTGPDGRSKGFGHVEFESIEDATAAVESGLEEPFHLAGRDLRVDYGAERTATPVNKLYFSGFAGEEQGLRALFGEFANEIRSIFFLRDNASGQMLPTGFVEFSSIAVATDALNKISGVQTPNGAKLSLNYAKPRQPVRTGSRPGESREYTRDNYSRKSGRDDY